MWLTWWVLLVLAVVIFSRLLLLMWLPLPLLHWLLCTLSTSLFILVTFMKATNIYNYFRDRCDSWLYYNSFYYYCCLLGFLFSFFVFFFKCLVWLLSRFFELRRLAARAEKKSRLKQQAVRRFFWDAWKSVEIFLIASSPARGERANLASTKLPITIEFNYQPNNQTNKQK